jgi:hypothetical protein
MICSSNVFFINNPGPELRLKLDPDPKKKINNNFGCPTLPDTPFKETAKHNMKYPQPLSSSY